MAEISRPEINVVLNDKTKQGTDSVNSNLDKINKKASGLSKAFDKAFGSVKTALFGVGIAGVTSKIIQATRRSSDFIEQLNVLDVAFNDNTKSIREFTSNIAETLNLDDASLIKMASSFKILANSMGYADEMGTKFSKLMTSITTDTASLFNMTLSDTQAMMQSAVQGQTKALRKRTGVSILDRDVQTTLDVLGIDAYVQDMNSAEKSLARVITMTYRLRESQGDLARTIESPANRFRVLSEQISLLARNIGNVFLPTISAILPYLNAVLIVLNKLISSLATLLGFREDAWDTYKAQTDTLSEAFDDLGTSVGGVGNAAKETKKQLNGLRGFDKLNVIKTPTPSSASGGGGGSGINPNLLKAFNTMFDNYKSMLSGVETKATKIANAIMKALGQIDFSNLISAGERLWNAFKPFAENVGKGLLWTFENVLVPIGKWYIQDYLPAWLDMLADGFTILNNAIEVFKPAGEWLWKSFLSPLAKWTGGTIINVLKKFNDILGKISKNKLASTLTTMAIAGLLLHKNFGKLVTILGKSKLLGALSNLSKPLTTLITKSKAWQTLSPKIGNGIFTITQTLGKLKGMLIDVGIASVGLIGFKTSMDDIATSGLNLGNSLGAVASGLATIGGLASAGNAIFPGYGALIGGVAGAFGLLVTGISEYKYVSSGLKEFNENTQATFDNLSTSLDNLKSSYQKTKDSIQENYDIKLAEMDQADAYIDGLYELVDANGKVKQGYEDEAQVLIDKLNQAYGTNITLQDGIITNDGKQIKDKETMIKLAEQYAQKLLKQALYEGYLEEYKDALRVRREAQKKLNEAQDEYNTELDKLKKKYDEGKLKGKDYHDALEKLQEKQNKSVEKYQEILYDTYPAINGLKDVTKAYTKGTTEDLQKAIDKTQENVNFSVKAIDDQVKKASKSVDDYINNELSRVTKEQAASQKIAIDNFNKNKDDIFKIQKGLDDINKKSVKPKLDTSSLTSSWDQWKKKNLNTTVKISVAGTSSKADGGILVNGKWRDVATYDTGGLPPVGQMFVAREKGPELVGQIGGHTAVMNNNQIVSSVSSGVAQAVRAVIGKGSNNNSVFNIYLDENHKIGSYTLEQLQGMAKSNGKPIRIG